jgi:hypothetical protein
MTRRIIVAALVVLALTVPAAAAASQKASAAPSASSKASAGSIALQRRGEGEVRIKGRVKRLSRTSITVANATRRVTYHRRARPRLFGIHVGTRVEAEGRRINGVLTLTAIHREN